jgi:hypothetical protein
MIEELAGTWEVMAEMEDAAKPSRRETLRECADTLRMLLAAGMQGQDTKDAERLASPANTAAATGEREAFEAWAEQEQMCPLDKQKDGDYCWAETVDMWKCWQAARARPALTDEQKEALHGAADNVTISNATGNEELFLKAVTELLKLVRDIAGPRAVREGGGNE